MTPHAVEPMAEQRSAGWQRRPPSEPPGVPAARSGAAGRVASAVARRGKGGEAGSGQAAAGPGTTRPQPADRGPARRDAGTSTSTTPTACGCRSCSPSRRRVAAGRARTSSRQGRVEVDGQVVTELGVRVRPDADRHHVDGMRLQLDDRGSTSP